MEEQNKRANPLQKTNHRLSQLSLDALLVKINFNDGSHIDYASHKDKAKDLLGRDMDDGLEHGLMPVIKIQRSHGEGTLTFTGLSAFGHERFKDINKYTKNLEQKFEEASIVFMDEIMMEIFEMYPESRYTFVLTNKKLRDAVIRKTFEERIRLSPREQACLWECGQGKSIKEAARALRISPTTVRRHLESIKEVFAANNLPQIFIECVHRGIVGKYNTAHPS